MIDWLKYQWGKILYWYRRPRSKNHILMKFSDYILNEPSAFKLMISYALYSVSVLYLILFILSIVFDWHGIAKVIIGVITVISMRSGWKNFKYMRKHKKDAYSNFTMMEIWRILKK